MATSSLSYFKARLDIIGINPFVFVPENILQQIFRDATKDKGPIPVCGTVNGNAYLQTLLRYKDEWRLYINTTMLSHSPKRIGELLEISIQFDPADRTIQIHPELLNALAKNTQARQVFEAMTPSARKEIIRYIAGLKTSQSVAKNIQRCINFLNGNGSFVGRTHP